MATLRFTVIKDTPYAPQEDGNLVMYDYQKRILRGRLDRLPYDTPQAPAPLLKHYLGRAVPARTSDLPVGAPVVFLIHGFGYDPRGAFGDNPAQSDNPRSLPI